MHLSNRLTFHFNGVENSGYAHHYRLWSSKNVFDQFQEKVKVLARLKRAFDWQIEPKFNQIPLNSLKDLLETVENLLEECDK